MNATQLLLPSALFILVAGSAQAIAPASHLSFEGSSGLLRIPNAEVAPHGSIDGQWNNDLHPDQAQRSRSMDSYQFMLGVWPGLEIGGRLAEGEPRTGPRYSGFIKRGLRDLSGNAKLQLFNRDGWPKLAIGMQDFAGEAQNFRARYVVASHEWWRLRATIGYGNGPDRLDGAFGGLELAAHRHLDLLAEHDGEHGNIGARLHGPMGNSSARWYLIGKAASGNDDYSLGLGLRLPLGMKRHDAAPISAAPVVDMLPADNSRQPDAPPPLTDADKNTSQPPQQPRKDADIGIPASAASTASSANSAEDQAADIPPTTLKARLQAIVAKLEQLHLEKIRAGIRDDTLVLWYENLSYRQNALDGLAVVLGVAAELAPAELERVEVTALQRGVAQLQVETELAAYRAFLQNPHDQVRFLQQLSARAVRTASDARTQWLARSEFSNRTWLRVVLRPDLRSYVGTEVGNFHYSLALAVDGIVPLWQGAQLLTTWHAPLETSAAFEDGHVFARDAHEGGLQDALLQQIVRLPLNLTNLTGIGKAKRSDGDYDVATNETVWRSPEGAHQLRLELGLFDRGDFTRDIAIGSYRYYWHEQDLAFEASYGQFWYDDRGVTLQLRRYFGDTAVSVFFKTVDRENQVGGLQISLPLTPRRTPRLGPVMVSGTNRWSYGLQTTVNRPSGDNIVNPNILLRPTRGYDLVQSFYDSDRLSPAYVRQHILRLRDAYRTYVLE